MAINPQAVVDALKKRRFDAYYAPTAQDAVAQALALIPAQASVSWGGSVSVQQSGLLAAV
ncbi:MAG: lactate utilization protein [Treponemataceae bacterium]|nr:lactate utilization protein [Treponemataceae bacterium]